MCLFFLGLLAFAALITYQLSTAGSARPVSIIFRCLTYMLQSSAILSVRTTPFASPIGGLFNFQIPATNSGLCPFTVSLSDKLLIQWALPLLAIAAFAVLCINLTLPRAQRCWRLRATKTAAFCALGLFLFSALTMSTLALLQVPLPSIRMLHLVLCVAAVSHG